MPENFLEINRYFALTSNYDTIGQSNHAFSILEFSLAGKRRFWELSIQSKFPEVPVRRFVPLENS